MRSARTFEPNQLLSRRQTVGPTPPMPKRRRISQAYPWAVFVKDVPPKFVGIIDNAPDAQTAIERAIEQYRVPPNERGWLVAVRPRR